MTSVVAKMADAVSGASSKLNGHANGAPSSYAAKFNLASHFIGGSELSKAPPSKVKDFVAASDGHTVISSVSFDALEGRESVWRWTWESDSSTGPHCE
jgi:acetyl-CoA carboxylase/biotin carboxylase 1